MQMHCNGIDVGKLFSRLEQVRKDPAEGAYEYCIESEWEGGYLARSYSGKARIGRESLGHSSHHAVTTDLLPFSEDSDCGFCPIELMLCALSGCLIAGYAAHAATLGIRLHSARVTVTGDGDLSGIFGQGAAKPGLTAIRVETTISSDEPAEKIRDLHKIVMAHSPVWDTLANRVPIEAKLVLDEESYGSVGF